MEHDFRWPGFMHVGLGKFGVEQIAPMLRLIIIGFFEQYEMGERN